MSAIESSGWSYFGPEDPQWLFLVTLFIASLVTVVLYLVQYFQQGAAGGLGPSTEDDVASEEAASLLGWALSRSSWRREWREAWCGALRDASRQLGVSPVSAGPGRAFIHSPPLSPVDTLHHSCPDSHEVGASFPQGPVVLTVEEGDVEATDLVVGRVCSFRKSAANTVAGHLFTVLWKQSRLSAGGTRQCHLLLQCPRPSALVTEVKGHPSFHQLAVVRAKHRGLGTCPSRELLSLAHCTTGSGRSVPAGEPRVRAKRAHGDH